MRNVIGIDVKGGDGDEQSVGLVNAAHDNHNADGREVTAMSRAWDW